MVKPPSTVLMFLETCREAANVAYRADPSATVRGGVRLATVLDYGKMAPARDGHDPPHVAGVAEEVHDNDGRGLAGDARFYRSRVHVERAGRPIGKDRDTPLEDDARNRAEVRDGRRDDLAAGFQVQRRHGEMDGGRPRTRGYRVLYPVHAGKPPLEVSHFRPGEREQVLAPQHLFHLFPLRGSEGGPLGEQPRRRFPIFHARQPFPSVRPGR